MPGRIFRHTLTQVSYNDSNEPSGSSLTFGDCDKIVMQSRYNDSNEPSGSLLTFGDCDKR